MTIPSSALRAEVVAAIGDEVVCAVLIVPRSSIKFYYPARLAGICT
jgi:hypothetical protein